MEIEITVKYFSNAAGAGKLRAVGSGTKAAKGQVTIGYPHELHHSMKYYEAARELEAKLERKNGWNLRLVRRSFFDSVCVGASRETFHYEVFNQTVPRFDNLSAVRYDRPAGYATGY